MYLPEAGCTLNHIKPDTEPDLSLAMIEGLLPNARIGRKRRQYLSKHSSSVSVRMRYCFWSSQSLRRYKTCLIFLRFRVGQTGNLSNRSLPFYSVDTFFSARISPILSFCPFSELFNTKQARTAGWRCRSSPVFVFPLKSCLISPVCNPVSAESPLHYWNRRTQHSLSSRVLDLRSTFVRSQDYIVKKNPFQIIPRVCAPLWP